MLICLEQDKQECQKLYCLQRDVHFMQVIMITIKRLNE